MILKFCIVSVLLGYSCTSAFLKGRPLINVTQHYPCPNFNNQILVAEGNITAYNKTIQLVTGFAKFTVAIDKTYKGGAVISRLVNNKWHKDLVVEKDDPCVTLRLLLGPIYIKLLEVAHAGSCPVQPGTYSVTDFPIDGRSVSLIYATGLFNVDGYLISKKDNKMKFCYHVEAMITVE